MKTTSAKIELARSQQHLEISDCVLKIAISLVNLLNGDAATFGAVAGKVLLAGAVVLQLAKMFRRRFPRSKGAKDSTLPKRFTKIICKSKCPFAKKAKLLGATLDPLRPIKGEVKRVEESLIGFTRVARKKKGS